jgi:hypothetical protein
MPEPILTTARHAVWNAIETWPSLEHLFKRRFRFEDYPGKVAGRPSPTIGEIPAIAIYPDTAQSTWALNQSQDVRYPLRIDFWTREWDVREGERIWEELIKALYQNLSPSSDAVRRIVGFTPLSPQLVNLGDANDGPLATKWTFQVELSAGFWNPKTSN